jgi:hypothetical protein
MRKHQITNLQSQVRRMRARSAQRCQQRSAKLSDTLPEQWHPEDSDPKAHGAMYRIAEPPKTV